MRLHIKTTQMIKVKIFYSIFTDSFFDTEERETAVRRKFVRDTGSFFFSRKSLRTTNHQVKSK